VRLCGRSAHLQPPLSPKPRHSAPPPNPRRLRHFTRADLSALTRLTSLFLLTLASPLNAAGAPAGPASPGGGGGGGAVRLAEVERAAEGMPYCDVELEGEAPHPAE
jgi:hypothetical protein